MNGLLPGYEKFHLVGKSWVRWIVGFRQRLEFLKSRTARFLDVEAATVSIALWVSHCLLITN
jgi:hypothetical protein